jgi:replicative DNA helicase
MNIEDIIKKIESEKEKAKTEPYSNDGLIRLQETAMKYNGEYKLVWSTDVLDEIRKQPRKAMHLTGVSSVDNLLGGFRDQMMIGVAAHSGHGKTTMGIWFLKQYERLNPVLIPLEQSFEELLEQRDSQGQFVPRFLAPQKHQARVQADWIEQRVIEGIAKYNSRLFVIDHLGYVDADPKYDRDLEHLRIERKLQEIKNIAKTWNVIIMLLIHITQLDESTPPSLLNLKGSAAIRQECDKVILLWRKNAQKGKVRIYENETLFSLQKNRWSGKNGNIGLLFDPATGDYTEHNDWVKQMEEMAVMEMRADEQF